jgi:hypothetical protein
MTRFLNGGVTSRGPPWVLVQCSPRASLWLVWSPGDLPQKSRGDSPMLTALGLPSQSKQPLYLLIRSKRANRPLRASSGLSINIPVTASRMYRMYHLYRMIGTMSLLSVDIRGTFCPQRTGTILRLGLIQIMHTGNRSAQCVGAHMASLQTRVLQTR